MRRDTTGREAIPPAAVDSLGVRIGAGITNGDHFQREAGVQEGVDCTGVGLTTPGDRVERIFREVSVTPGQGQKVWVFPNTIAMLIVTVVGGAIGGEGGVERPQTGMVRGGGPIEGEGGSHGVDRYPGENSIDDKYLFDR